MTTIATAGLTGFLAGRDVAAQVEPSQFLPLLPRWSASLSAPPSTRPILAGQVVVVALQTGGVLALKASDGTDAWRSEVSAAHPVAADEQHTYVASRDTIHALRLSTGEEAWRADTGTLTAAPLIHSGWLIAAAGGNVTAFRAADGAALWSRPIGVIDATPSIDGDLLFVSLLDGRIVALNLTTGEQRWESRLGGAPAEPLAIGGKVYAGASDKWFYTLNADDGEIVSRFRVGAAPRGRPAVDDRSVYYIALDNVLRAFDRGDGALEWRKSLAYRPASGPVVIGTAIVVPGSIAALPVFGRDGTALTDVKFPSTLVWVSNATIGPSGYPLVGVVTGDLEHPWTLWLLEASADPPPLPLVPLTAAPGVTIEVVLPG